jgi:2-dehydropantoate 2-reductase
LQQAGQEVSLLARGARLAALREHGLILEDLVSGQRSTAAVRIVESLAPDDAYDLIAVVMGRHHVAAALPALAANRATPTFLFIGNNVAGPDALVAALGRERVLLGFLDAGGAVRDGIVGYVAEIGGHKAQVTLGELDGSRPPRLARLVAALKGAGFQAEICPQMDALLKTHAAGIVPLASAYYAAGSDIRRVASDRQAVARLIAAMREGLRVLQALGIPLVPPRQKILLRLPEWLLIPLGQRLLRNPALDYALVHADGARPEMRVLAAELLALARRTAIPTPALDVLVWRSE